MGHAFELEITGACTERTQSDSAAHAVSRLRRATTGVRLFLLTMVVAFGGLGLPAFAQGDLEGTYPSGLALTVSGNNSQFPLYSDNSAGLDVALFYQRSALLGVQVKGATYPYSARFKQSPITAGYRIGRRPYVHDLSMWTGWNPFAYLGGGYSHSQDSGTDHLATPAVWEPCWQGSIGIDRQYKYFSWRVAEISYTQTFAPNGHIRSVGLDTGLIFNFRYSKTR